jgi:hypothetical protein
MSYELHPLSAAFPAMPASELLALVDGVRPASHLEVKTMVASDWFKGLKKSQRAVFVSLWSPMAAASSNQHITTVETRSPRYAAEVAQQLISKAAQ